MTVEWWCDLDGAFVAPAELLDRTFSARISDHDVTVHLPSLPNRQCGLSNLGPPHIWGSDHSSDGWGEVHQARGDQPVGVAVERFVLIANVPDSEVDIEETARALVESTDRWRDALKTWLEIVTGQHLTDVAHQPVRYIGHRTPIMNVSPDRTLQQPISLMAFANLTFGATVPAVTSDIFAGCLTQASIGAPTLAWILLRDARSLAEGGQYRRAVIDSATATELAINLMMDALSMVKRAKTLGGKIKQLRDLGQPLDANLYADLVLKRNDAVHEARPVGVADCDTAIAASAAVVEAAYPLPSILGHRRW